jgi:hypothetical protein
LLGWASYGDVARAQHAVDSYIEEVEALPELAVVPVEDEDGIDKVVVPQVEVDLPPRVRVCSLLGMRASAVAIGARRVGWYDGAAADPPPMQCCAVSCPRSIDRESS